jgi:serine/threonine protein kinase
MGAASPIEAVQTLGKYTLLEKLGEGYLGSVYRGIDQDLDRAVAVRVLCGGIKWDARIDEIFSRQCHLVSGLSHPGIASLYDIGCELKTHFLAMESLGSSTLESLIAQKTTMTAESKIAIMVQVAEGLSHAHKKRILHRDLTPGKIHLVANGAAKIRDFAIAHVLMKYLPHPAIRWGTPIYLSPEQVQQKECDHRSDIFAAGTIFYELLTYHHPFFDRDGNKALDNILLKTDLPTFESFPEVPPGIWPILKTCLEKNPKDRYADMSELSAACRELLTDMAEDTRLMLAELYAAAAPIKKAASQLEATESVAVLHKEIQKLLKGEKQPDYVSMDHLMTALLEYCPSIQGADKSSPSVPAVLSSPEETGSSSVQKAGLSSLHAPLERQDPLFIEQPLSAAPVHDGTRLSVAPAVASQAPLENVGKQAEAETLPRSGSPEQSNPPAGLPGNSETSVIKSRENPDRVGRTDAGMRAEQKAEGAEPRKESPDSKREAGIPSYRKARRRSYRAAAVLLALLLIAAATYIVFGKDLAGVIGNTWKPRLFSQGVIADVYSFLRGGKGQSAMAAGTADSPKSSTEMAITRVASDASGAISADSLERDLYQPSQERINRISALINSGKLSLARVELDKLQQIYPDSAPVVTLRRQWQAKDAAAAREKAIKEQEQLKATRKQREDELSRQVTGLFDLGKYSEAENTLNLWLAENPENRNALSYVSRIGDIQRSLQSYSAAMTESRYPDALNAIAAAERINPADSNFAELRRQAEAKRAAARASLTVYRLGPKGVILMDGQSIGSDGEIENESIPIGTHTLVLENSGNPSVARRVEFMEGQRVTLVYDLGRQNLRPMVDADRELLTHRKKMEEVRYFEVEHSHGALRGSCRGTLTLDPLDTAFKPSSGYHAFRIPFKLLKIEVNGKSITLLNVADGKPLQSFKFRDEQAAVRFNQSWEELKAYSR